MNFEYNSQLAYGMRGRFPGTGPAPAGASSPFYTISNQYIPRDLKSLLKWVDYILGQSPLVSETLRKYSTYPITEFVHDTDNVSTRKAFEATYKALSMKQTLGDIGMNFFSKGNAIVSLHYKIDRHLKCQSCGASHSIRAISYKFTKETFQGTCPSCHHTGVFTRNDLYKKSPEGMRLVLWNMMQISVHHNPITGRSDYYYQIPKRVCDAIRMGDKMFMEDTPWEIIQCALRNKELLLDRNKVYHLRNVSLNQAIEGLGTPPLISLYHLVFYEATLRKANEAIATEYLMPLRIVSPAPQTGQSDPIVNASMKTFVSNMTRLAEAHRRDGNAIAFSPIPVSYQPISGEGRTLLVNQEIANAQQTMLLGLGVSQELLSGTSNWTSSTVGLRMLNNMLLNYTSQLEDFFEWLNQKISAYLSVDSVKTSLVPFKLTDDSENKQFMMSLYQAGKVSDSSMMELLGVNISEERERIIDDAAERAAMEVRMQAKVEMARFAASKEAAESMRTQDGGDYQATLEDAQRIAEQLVNAPEDQRRMLMNQLQSQEYPKYLMVSKLLEQMKLDQTKQLKEQAQAQAADQVNPVTGSPEIAGADVAPGEDPGEPAPDQASTLPAPQAPKEPGRLERDASV